MFRDVFMHVLAVFREPRHDIEPGLTDRQLCEIFEDNS